MGKLVQFAMQAVIFAVLLQSQGCVYALAYGHAAYATTGAKLKNYSCSPSGEVVDKAGKRLENAAVSIVSYPFEPGPTLLAWGGGPSKPAEPSSVYHSQNGLFKARTYGSGFRIVVTCPGYVREEFGWSGKDQARDDQTRTAMTLLGHSVGGTARSPKFRFVMEASQVPRSVKSLSQKREAGGPQHEIVLPVLVDVKDSRRRTIGTQEIGRIRIAVPPTVQSPAEERSGPSNDFTIMLEGTEAGGIQQAKLPAGTAHSMYRYLRKAPATGYSASPLVVRGEKNRNLPAAFYFRIGERYGRAIVSQISVDLVKGTIHGQVSGNLNQTEGDISLGD